MTRYTDEEIMDMVREMGGAHLLPRTDSLDAAWAEAEAALPEGWVLLGVNHAVPWGPYLPRLQGGEVFHEPAYHASAREDWSQQKLHVAAKTAVVGGATPAAALRALAARLREAR